jgi:hypothetical protein
VTRRSSNLIDYLKLAISFMAIPLMCGCVSQTAVLSGYTKPSAVAPFEIVDARPADERDTKFMSLLITSCDYAVRQVGDKDVVPDRISLLRDELNAAMGEQLAGKSLVVSHYGLHLNRAQAARNETYKANAGLVTGLMKDVGSRCKREEMKAGWFEPNDVTTPYSPFIVEITLAVDGKTHAVRSVYSPDKDLSPAFSDADTTAALFAAMKKATDKLIASLREG